MRKLSSEEIKPFANRVENSTPVWNFLGTCHHCSYLDALANLEMDARLYSWKDSTVQAIYDGLILANSPE